MTSPLPVPTGHSLSRILLNPRRAGARELLTNRHAMHAAVRSAWPSHSDTHPLWRLEPAGQPGTPPSLLVVGPSGPSWSHITEQAGWEAHPGQSRDYGPILDVVESHPSATYGFALDANPTICQQHRRRFLTAREDQLAWLERKGTLHGFMVVAADVSESALPDVFRRGKSRVTLPAFRFTGALTVTDPAAFAHALTAGIGRGKAFGCGLVTLARA